MLSFCPCCAHRAPGDARWGTPHVASGQDSPRGISLGRLGYPFHGTAWAPVPEGLRPATGGGQRPSWNRCPQISPGLNTMSKGHVLP